MIVLCTHHKGGVGKTELAIHVSGVLRGQLSRTLLMDCDSQRSSWQFYFGDSPSATNDPRPVDRHLTVVWNPAKDRARKLAAIEESYDHIVIDIDSPLE